MPLTKSGKKVLRNFRKKYGYKLGTKLFWRTLRSEPEKYKSWEKRRS